MAEVNVENMEDNAKMFEQKMGFAHDADGLDMSDEQLVNFLLMCQQEYVMGDDEEEYVGDQSRMFFAVGQSKRSDAHQQRDAPSARPKLCSIRGVASDAKRPRAQTCLRICMDSSGLRTKS